MRIAVFSDVHGNWEALQAVLADIDRVGVEALYCLGDVIGYGADPEICLETVQNRCAVILRGNHEQALLDPQERLNMNPVAQQALLWTAGRLSAAQVAAVSDWPLVRVGTDARLTHGSPHEPARFHYVQGRLEMENAFQAFAENLCLIGHTHQPLAVEEITPGVQRIVLHPEFEMEPGHRYLVNVGSVGQPRDGNPQARWVCITDHPSRIAFRGVDYNVAAAAGKIRRAGLPGILADRLTQGS